MEIKFNNLEKILVKAYEISPDLAKSIYKKVCKALDKTSKKYKRSDKKIQEEAESVVQDILDPNYVAEVTPEEIPETKDNVLWKKKSEKGISKLKKFVNKKEKGVHQSTQPKGGQSEAGESIRQAGKGIRESSGHKDEWKDKVTRTTKFNIPNREAKRKHRQALSEQQLGMKKPRLPK